MTCKACGHIHTLPSRSNDWLEDGTPFVRIRGSFAIHDPEDPGIVIQEVRIFACPVCYTLRTEDLE